MRTRISSKGQVVIPQAVRAELGLDQGSELDVRVEDGRVVLVPLRRSSWRGLLGSVGGDSLTQALEREHREDRAREG